MSIENPPAFPQQCADALDVGMVHEGMTLRDWFAGQALAGLFTQDWRHRFWYAKDGNGSTWELEAAKDAYRIADAMLAERARALASKPAEGEGL